MFFNRLLAINILLALLAAIVLSHEAFGAPDNELFYSHQVTVLSPLKFNSVQNIETFWVTEEDIRRGYADLPSAITVSYRTDASEMVIVEIASLGSEQIYMQDVGVMAYMVALPPSPARDDLTSLALDLRVMLPRETVAGIYPLSFYVVPTFL